MAKKRKKKSSGPITPLLLVLCFLIATLGVYSYIRFRPVGPAEIFVIEPVALTEGEIAITGTLIKDAPAGEPGTYLLILADNTAIILDIQDADLGNKVYSEKSRIHFLMLSARASNSSVLL